MIIKSDLQNKHLPNKATRLMYGFTSMRVLSHCLISFITIGFKLSFVSPQVINTLSGNGYFLDRFNYDVTVSRGDGFKDYGPNDWGDIQCDEQNSLRSCLAYRDKWETGREWSIKKNYCRNCPIDDPEMCENRHHQSPINLERAVGYEPYTHELANECIVSEPKRNFTRSVVMEK